jgi:hypothetical protein
MPKVERFISPLGPDKKDERCDVRFLESVVTFKEAQRRRALLQEQHDPAGNTLAIVVYRSSHVGDKYYLSRQIDFDLNGEERHPGAPQEGEKIGYDIFLAPKALLSQGEPRHEPELWKAVSAICDFGQGPPSDGGPD